MAKNDNKDSNLKNAKDNKKKKESGQLLFYIFVGLVLIFVYLMQKHGIFVFPS